MKFRIADNLLRPRSRWTAKSSTRYRPSWIVASTARNFSILWNGSATKGQRSTAPGSPPRTSSTLRNMFGISTDVIRTNPALLNGLRTHHIFFIRLLTFLAFISDTIYHINQKKKKKTLKTPHRVPAQFPHTPLRYKTSKSNKKSKETLFPTLRTHYHSFPPSSFAPSLTFFDFPFCHVKKIFFQKKKKHMYIQISIYWAARVRREEERK